MKVLFLFILSVTVRTQGEDDEDVVINEEENRKQIEGLKGEQESIDKNKNVIWTWLNMQKNPIKKEDADKVAKAEYSFKFNGSNEFLIKPLPNVDGELIDTNY